MQKKSSSRTQEKEGLWQICPALPLSGGKASSGPRGIHQPLLDQVQVGWVHLNVSKSFPRLDQNLPPCDCSLLPGLFSGATQCQFPPFLQIRISCSEPSAARVLGVVQTPHALSFQLLHRRHNILGPKGLLMC